MTTASWKGQESRRRRIQNMLNKRDKLAMVEALLYSHERAPSPDTTYIKQLKKQANELRTQIAVSSTQLTQ